MNDLPFYWMFVVLAGVVDLVGLFFLWRRRNSPVSANHRRLQITTPRMRLPLAERRRRDRRGSDQAASA
jgi:hypothetical protein